MITINEENILTNNALNDFLRVKGVKEMRLNRFEFIQRVVALHPIYDLY